MLVFLLTCTLPVGAQRSSSDAQSLRGKIRDLDGKPIAGATILLQNGNNAKTLTADCDSEGNYSFRAVDAGVYLLLVKKAGYADASMPSVSLGPNESRTLDFTLDPTKPPAPSGIPAQAPVFSDEPHFTISGISDPANLGGHGSDRMVQTQETLARDTVSLEKPRTGSQPALASATEKELRDRVQRSPNDFEANNRLGTALVENGRAIEAIPYLERASRLKPDDDPNAYELALATANAGEYALARDRVQKLLLSHDSAELHHLLGDLQERLGNYVAAESEYQRAADLEPAEQYFFDWGAELLVHYALQPAREVFSKGNRLFPASGPLLLGLGAVLFAEGDYEQAVQRICRASDLNPSDPAPYVFLGKIQKAEPTVSGLILDKLRRFVTLQPGNAQANYYYAFGLWQRGTNDAASSAQVESLLDKATALDPAFAEAYFELGVVHLQRGLLSKAISDFQRAIQIAPGMAAAHYRLAKAYRRAGEAEKARQEVLLFEQSSRDLAQKVEQQRREIQRFVYTLRDQDSAPNR